MKRIILTLATLATLTTAYQQAWYLRSCDYRIVGYQGRYIGLYCLGGDCVEFMFTRWCPSVYYW